MADAHGTEFSAAAVECLPIPPPSAGESAVQSHASAAEISAGRPAWEALAQLFSVRAVVAVGNTAHRSVLLSGQDAVKVRHPAHGGKAKFGQGLEDLLAQGIDDDGSGKSG